MNSFIRFEWINYLPGQLSDSIFNHVWVRAAAAVWDSDSGSVEKETQTDNIISWIIRNHVDAVKVFISFLIRKSWMAERETANQLLYFHTFCCVLKMCLRAALYFDLWPLSAALVFTFLRFSETTPFCGSFRKRRLAADSWIIRANRNRQVKLSQKVPRAPLRCQRHDLNVKISFLQRQEVVEFPNPTASSNRAVNTMTKSFIHHTNKQNYTK